MTIKKLQRLNEINRYNLHPPGAIQGAQATGYSSGRVIQVIRRVVAENLQPMGLSNGVQAQIGPVMLVGLLGKNAILIVEFAVQR